jgi:diketogulonate reductase-like aldo/keto reductase
MMRSVSAVSSLGRRAFLGGAVMAACDREVSATRAPARALAASAASPDAPEVGDDPSPMLTRPIPSTGELLPVIGMGTWQTFDAGEAAADRDPLREVLSIFTAAGGRVIDSSPMYGRAEAVAGDLMRELGTKMFVATKVWTRGRSAGIAEIERSMRRLRVSTLDLLQVHNLLDVHAHLPTLRALKERGTVRYIGITHYQLGAFAEVERLLRTESLDFVQLPYSIGVREAEARLLPAAADTGTAVLVMRPFEEGSLFARVRGRPLPGWAAEIDCTSWAQVFLKWIVGHPAVTCPIPATSDPDHASDNVLAGVGRLPDEALRERIASDVLG